ncbi:MAG: metallophosphoesterase family protein [Clostridium sp.]
MNSVKFAIFTDLHFDHVHDGYDRLNSFVKSTQKLNLDFIIQLGDLCTPINENKKLLELLDKTNLPIYHVLGNHDLEVVSKKAALNFLNLDTSYYSFRYGNIKFIILDTCFFKRNTNYYSFNNFIYNKKTDIYPILPDYELTWLASELKDDNLFYIIFSHHSLENTFNNRGVFNKIFIQSLINKTNTQSRKVLCCINGHDHANNVTSIHNTYYVGLNSMSYIWCGAEYEHFNYSTEIHSQYPFLKDLILYKDSLYATITIHSNGKIYLNGKISDYQTISPSFLGMPSSWNGRELSPNIFSIEI